MPGALNLPLLLLGDNVENLSVMESIRNLILEDIDLVTVHEKIRRKAETSRRYSIKFLDFKNHEDYERDSPIRDVEMCPSRFDSLAKRTIGGKSAENFPLEQYHDDEEVLSSPEKRFEKNGFDEITKDFCLCMTGPGTFAGVESELRNLLEVLFMKTVSDLEHLSDDEHIKIILSSSRKR